MPTPHRVRRAAIEHKSDSKAKFPGLTDAMYAFLYKGVRCDICRSEKSVVVGNTMSRLTIDHDHKKEQDYRSIRGVLCHQCNLLLGYAEDNPAILRAAIKYLKNYEENGGPFDRQGLTDPE